MGIGLGKVSKVNRQGQQPFGIYQPGNEEMKCWNRFWSSVTDCAWRLRWAVSGWLFPWQRRWLDIEQRKNLVRLAAKELADELDMALPLHSVEPFPPVESFDTSAMCETPDASDEFFDELAKAECIVLSQRDLRTCYYTNEYGQKYIWNYRPDLIGQTKRHIGRMAADPEMPGFDWFDADRVNRTIANTELAIDGHEAGLQSE